jgi:hypothetical protein
MKQRENILPAFGFMFFMTGMIMQLFEDIFKIWWQKAIVLSIGLGLYFLLLLRFYYEIDMFEKDIKKRSKKDGKKK